MDSFKPCPFCGGTIEIVGDNNIYDGRKWCEMEYAECQKCYMRSPSMEVDENNKIYFLELWNSRPKAVSDMARYIDADKLLEEVKRGGHALSEWSTLGVCAVIERQPTADVVPKSEVDKWVSRCGDFHEVAELKSQRVVELEAELSKAKAEVAREIFEEIEGCFMFGERIYSIDKPTFAELKKKYTEEQE